jgi:hypothetical protein
MIDELQMDKFATVSSKKFKIRAPHLSNYLQQ